MAERRDFAATQHGVDGDWLAFGEDKWCSPAERLIPKMSRRVGKSGRSSVQMTDSKLR
jgi:hypothetical protein